MTFSQVIGVALLGFLLFQFTDGTKEIKGNMAAEKRCFEDAVTKEDIDECYAFMRLNIKGE